MLTYEFNIPTESIFELDTLPHLSYIQKFNNYSDNLSILHRHMHILEILFINNGINLCSINNQSYKIKQGDLIVINNNTLHNVIEKPTKNISGYIIGISNLHLKNFKQNQLIKSNISPIIHSAEYLKSIQKYISLFDDFIQLNASINISLSLEHILQSFILFLFEIIYTTSNNKIINQEYHLGERIKNYIDNHFLEEITLKTISKDLNISEYYLSRTCKKFLGYSPIQYITKQRLKEAQNLLISTDLSITEIAFHCGYNNSNYFQSVFNNIVGMPPGKYRKSWK